MEIRYAFEVFGHVDERNQFRYVILSKDEFGEGFSPPWSRVCGAHVVFNLVKVAEVWVWEKYGTNMVQIV